MCLCFYPSGFLKQILPFRGRVERRRGNFQVFWFQGEDSGKVLRKPGLSGESVCL